MTTEPHYHVWTRAGKIFTMQEREFESRHTATKVARRLRPNPADRLVLACSDCPTSKRSRRQAPRPAVIARAIAEAVGAPVAMVRQALDAATATERRRRPERSLVPQGVEDGHDPDPATGWPRPR